jgi:hypothetical protein
MLRDLLTAFLAIAAALAIYRYRRSIVDRLRRFDANNVRRIREQEAEKTDPVAHFKHTLRIAEEQVEAVSEITVGDERLGTPVTRYIFEGERFATRADAERARAEKIRAIAHNYYVELPRALAERGAAGTVRGTSAAPKPPPQNPPSGQSNVVPIRRGDETLH